MLLCQYCGATSPDKSHFCCQCGRSLSSEGINIPIISSSASKGNAQTNFSNTSPALKSHEYVHTSPEKTVLPALHSTRPKSATSHRKPSRSVYVRWAVLIIAFIVIGVGVMKAFPLLVFGSSPTKTSSPDFNSFVGAWRSHSASLTFASDGHARYLARTYQWCGPGVSPPCDSIQGNLIVPGINEQLLFTRTSGSTAYGTVLSSTAGDAGQPITLVLLQHGTVMLSDNTIQSDTLCGPQSPPGYCGA